MSRASARSVIVAVLVLGLAACGDDIAPAPTVAVAEAIRGGFTLTREDHATNVAGTTRVERESIAATAADARASVRLDTGAFVLFDGATSAKVELSKLGLSAGRLFVDAVDAEETTVETAHGSVSARNATFAIAATGDETTVYCGAGEVTYRSERGSGQLAQGETLVLGAGAPETHPAELWDDWTGGLADPSPVRRRSPAYVGVLAGRRVDELGVARTALPIRSHEVSAVLRGDLAETTVTQTFFNARSDALEAEYTVRIPEGAIVQGFAIDTGSGIVEAAVGALATENGYDLTWLDPSAATSRLSWDGPDRLRARISPVLPGATLRVQLRYTEWLDRHDNMRTYVYPMQTGSDAPLISELVLEVDASGAGAKAYRAGMGAVVEGGRVVLRSSDFRPHADFYLDLVDDAAPPSDVARLFTANTPSANAPEGDEKYVLVEVPTSGVAAEGEAAGPEAPLELVLLVDASGATDAEDSRAHSRNRRGRAASALPTRPRDAPRRRRSCARPGRRARGARRARRTGARAAPRRLGARRARRRHRSRHDASRRRGARRGSASRGGSLSRRRDPDDRSARRDVLAPGARHHRRAAAFLRDGRRGRRERGPPGLALRGRRSRGPRARRGRARGHGRARRRRAPDAARSVGRSRRGHRACVSAPSDRDRGRRAAAARRPSRR